jgi:thiaminase
VVQDHQYLDTYAAMLNVLASKTESRAHAAFFTTCARQVLSDELGMHIKLLTQWGMTEQQALDSEMQPSGLLYTSYLRATLADRPFHEGANCTALSLQLHLVCQSLQYALPVGGTM